MSAGRYRKKPVEVDAIRWVGTNLDELHAWADDLCEHNVNVRTLHAHVAPDDQLRFEVVKGQSECTIDSGDWIIAEADGDGFYPCTAEQFAATYEPVEVTA